MSVLKIEDGWITSSQNFYPDSKDTISDQELLSAFLESYVVNNTSKTLVNLLFKGEILKETDGITQISYRNTQIGNRNTRISNRNTGISNRNIRLATRTLACCKYTDEK